MKSILGLDIGSRTIKLVELGKERNTISLVSVGTISTPPKALTSKIAADSEAVAVAIKQLLKDANARSRDVNLALPESQVFTRVIEMPQLSSRELTSALQWEAEQYIPLPLDQVNVDFSVLRDSKETGTNKMDVLLVASPKTLLEKYVNYLDLAGLNPIGVETEIISVSRALASSVSTVRTALIVSLGAQTTDLAILRGNVLSFTRSISAGGDALSRALAQSLGLEAIQAEEFKKTYGLEPDKLEGKIVTAVKPIMDTIINEIKRAVAFYVEKYPNDRVEVILLSGGTARIPGMVVYIAENIGSDIEIQLANPWVGIQRDARLTQVTTDAATYCVAVGLALRV